MQLADVLGLCSTTKSLSEAGRRLFAESRKRRSSHNDADRLRKRVPHMQIAQRLQASLGHGSFRPYATDDVTGVALGGAAKNVYAIACGIVEGMGLGESARAALLARSFAELRRLGEALGARSETLMGLSGLGDLVLTATSPGSRNFSFGLALGKGATRAGLNATGRPLAEGVETAPALLARARRHGVELPIAETTAAILDGTRN